MSDNGGVFNPPGVSPILRSVYRGASAFTAAASTAIFPLMSIRPVSGTQTSVKAQLTSLTIETTATLEFLTYLMIAPTVGGTDAASWQNLTGTSLQYDISRTSTNVLTGGIVIATFQRRGSLQVLDGALALPRDWAYTGSTARELVIGVQHNLGSGTPAFFGAVNIAQE